MTQKKYAYYDGGVIRHGTVPETDVTPEVKFSYSPLSIAQHAVYEGKFMSLENNDVPGIVNLQCDLISKSLKSWNLKKLNTDGTESTVEFKDSEALKKVDNFIIDEIFKTINQAPTLPIKQAKN